MIGTSRPQALVIPRRGGVGLAGVDFGGDGPALVLLHGLAGHAGEWADTARWATARRRVVALDARGHGDSERCPADVSRAAHVADAAFAIERLQLGPAVVVGQSLGGQTALLLAAERPDLVCGLIVADASPVGGDDPQAIETGVAEVRDSLARWPVPFPSREAAIEFFGGPSLTAEAWAGGLEHRADGYWPRFDVEVMVRTLREAAGASYWDAWERIARPTLVVRAGQGIVPAAEAEAMVRRGRDVTLATLPGAPHDLHLDQPAEWRRVVTAWLDRLPGRPAPSAGEPQRPGG